MVTSVEFMSGTRPIQWIKGLGASHALAGQYLGMKSIYLEVGSGAKTMSKVELLNLYIKYIYPQMLEGISSPEIAAKMVKAGASIVVVERQ